MKGRCHGGRSAAPGPSAVRRAEGRGRAYRQRFTSGRTTKGRLPEGQPKWNLCSNRTIKERPRKEELFHSVRRGREAPSWRTQPQRTQVLPARRPPQRGGLQGCAPHGPAPPTGRSPPASLRTGRATRRPAGRRASELLCVRGALWQV